MIIPLKVLDIYLILVYSIYRKLSEGDIGEKDISAHRMV